MTESLMVWCSCDLTLLYSPGISIELLLLLICLWRLTINYYILIVKNYIMNYWTQPLLLFLFSFLLGFFYVEVLNLDSCWFLDFIWFLFPSVFKKDHTFLRLENLIKLRLRFLYLLHWLVGCCIKLFREC